MALCGFCSLFGEIYTHIYNAIGFMVSLSYVLYNLTVIIYNLYVIVYIVPLPIRIYDSCCIFTFLIHNE